MYRRSVQRFEDGKYLTHSSLVFGEEQPHKVGFVRNKMAVERNEQ